jgi:glucosylceramidase
MARKALKKWISSTSGKTWKERSVALRPAKVRDEVNLELDGSHYQTWEGFGTCFNELGWQALQALDPKKSQAILKHLFKLGDDCGFNFCRLPIGANDYAEKWYSHNENPGDYAMERFSIARDKKILIPYLKAALKLKPDIILFASPWSPPAWMKEPSDYKGGRLRWEAKNLKAYALYFRKFVEAYRKEGIHIRQIHVQNEPDSNQIFPSCLWSGEQLRDFIRDYLGPEFKKHKVDCEIWLGTMERAAYDKWTGAVLGDPKARGFLSGVGFQWEGKGAIQRAHEAWPRMRLLQTENECGDGKNTWDYAETIFALMRHYMANGVVGYTYWNPILQPRGRSTWGWDQNALITIDLDTKKVTYNPEYYLFKHFSHFIHPGAIRRGMEGEWATYTVAFENPSGETVLVIHNPFSKSKPLCLGWKGGVLTARLEGHSFNTIVL